MTRLRRALAAYRDGTEPRADEAARVKRGVEAIGRPRLLARLTTIDATAQARVRANVDGDGVVARGRLWPALVAFATIPVVAGLVLTLGRGPVALTGRLYAEAPREEPLTELVQLRYQGAGAVAGTERAPRIRWEQGRLHTAVTPGRGVALTVETPEALVEVVGTVFDVDRDVLGTHVAVARGHVRVRCGDERSPRELLTGDAHTCLPTRPAGLLSRARRLAEDGAPAADVLDSLDRGLAAGPEEAARVELRAVRAATLARSGRADEALVETLALLAGGAGPRTGELARLAARLSLPSHGCVETLRLLDLVPPDERLATDEIARADCLAADAPEAARAALLSALDRAPTDLLRARIRARLADLSPRSTP